jgi:hypothetical protein
MITPAQCKCCICHELYGWVLKVDKAVGKDGNLVFLQLCCNPIWLSGQIKCWDFKRANDHYSDWLFVKPVCALWLERIYLFVYHHTGNFSHLTSLNFYLLKWKIHITFYLLIIMIYVIKQSGTVDKLNLHEK